MFGRRVFGGSADTFRLTLELGERAGLAITKSAPVDFEWTNDESDSAVLERFTQRKSELLFGRLEERVVASVLVSDFPPNSVRLLLSLEKCMPTLRCLQVSRVSSSGTVSESLLTAMLKHCDTHGVWKVKSSDGCGAFLFTCSEVGNWPALTHLNLSHCNIAALPPSVGDLAALTILRLSYNKLPALPAEVGKLTALQVLSADHNALAALPPELRSCTALRELHLENNRLTTPLLDLRNAAHLVSLQLFGNPLELLPELSPCRQLRSLSIANVRIRADPPFRRWDLEVSPLSYMTRSHKLAPLFALLFRRSSCQHPLLAGALAKLAEERSSCELLAKEDMALPQMVTLAMSSNAVVASAACRALASLAALDEATARKLVSHDLGRTILTLVSSRDASVQLSGCHVLAALCGGNEAVALELASSQLVVQLLQLLLPGSSSHDVQQAALEALGNMAFAKANAARIRGVAGLLQVVSQLAEPPEGAECASAAGVSSTAAGTATVALLPSARGSGGGAGLTASSTVVTAATVGGSAARVSSSGDGSDGRQQHLVSTTSNASSSAAAVISSSAGNAVGMAATATSTTTQVVLTEQQRTRQYAIRLLAVLGENDLVRQSLRQPPIEGRGVRVLALDGGGMKGMTMVAFIRHLERATGKRMAELFDVIAGTSTGGILAVGLGMLGYSADDCDATYNNLGAKVFSRGGADVDADDGSGGGGGSGSSGGKGFQASLSRLYHSTSQATRVAVYGCKHDPSTFEELLHSSCSLLRAGVVTGNRMIDSACLGGPKIVVMSTLTSVSPVQPFAFRNYELPHDAEAAAREACAPRGSSRHLVWQAIRSSSAAPMYLEEFLVGEDRFQDGCLTYNNPTLVAIQQARLLYPHLPVDCVVSLGCGNTPDARREKAGSLFLDLGSVLLETSLSVDRTHEALSTLMPLVPGCRYYRFNPIDKRCGMAPDSVDPVAWAALRAATQEYCATQEARLDELASLLSNGASEAEAGAAGGAGDASGGRAGRVRSIGSDGGAASGAPAPGASLRLGFRKGLLVVQALRSSLAAAASPVELADDVVAQLPHVVHVTPLSKPKLSAPESHAVDDGSSSDSADEGADSTSSDAAAGDAAAPAAPPTASTTSSLFNYFSGYFSPAATGAALPATPASSAHKAAAAAASTTATPAAASSSAQQQQQLQPVEMELMPVGASAAAEMQTHGSHRSGGGRGILSPHPAGGWRLSTSALLQAAPWSSSEDPSKPGPNASAAPENAARPANQEPGDQPSTTTATAAAAALVGRERLRHVLSIYGDRSGVVHLGVHSVAGSPVLSWHHDVFSVLEPSQQAAELLKLLRPVQQQQRVRDGRRSRAGSTGGGPAVAPPLASGHHACAASLSELCAQHSCFQLPGGMLLTVLSRQEVTTPTGATLSSFIFQRTSPAELLTPYDVSAMLDHWHHQVVVCPSHLAPELVDALLRAGARAVVSCAAPLEPLTAAASLPAGSPADDASFWSVFYGAFFGGEPLGRALQQAEAAHKQLTGRFVLQCK